MSFWEQFFQNVITAIISAGVAGGFFWQLLQKSIDQKLATVLEKHKADLAEQVHAKNTVFTRLDKQRADAIQRLHAKITAFRWEFVTFAPSSSLNNPNDKTIPSLQAITWCVMTQREAKNILRIHMEFSLLLPDELNMMLGAGWYQLANAISVELIRVFQRVADSDEYQQADDVAKREMLSRAKREFNPEYQDRFFKIDSEIVKLLKDTLISVEKFGGCSG